MEVEILHSDSNSRGFAETLATSFFGGGKKKEAAATTDFVKNLHTDWWGEADLPSGWDVWAFIRKFYARKARDCHAQGGKDGLALVDGRQLVTISEKVGPSKLPPRNHGNGKFPFHLHMGHCP